MKLFRNKSKPILGLDISSTSVKLVELGRQGDRYRLESYAIKSLPPNAEIASDAIELVRWQKHMRDIYWPENYTNSHAALEGKIRRCFKESIMAETLYAVGSFLTGAFGGSAIPASVASASTNTTSESVSTSLFVK